MSHIVRIHKITHQAEDAGKRILNSIPKQEPQVGMGLRRPLWHKAKYSDTEVEKNYLESVANDYNAMVSHDKNLIAHGTQDCSSLCQILMDGELKHVVGIENYGNLGCGPMKSVQAGGYWDNGWGVFVTTPAVLKTCDIDEFLIVPLEKLNAILLPRQTVDAVRSEFPEHTNLLRSYKQFADEIKRYL